MDMQPLPSYEDKIDLLPSARAKRFGKHVRQLEAHLKSRWFEEGKTSKLLKKVRRDVGSAAIGKRSSLLAVGYTYDPSGYIDPTPVVIDSNEAHFKEVSVHSIDGEDRVLFDYEIYDADNDAVMWPYSIPPSAIARAEVDTSRSHRAFDYIDNNKTLALNMFQSTDFFHLNPEQQHMLLRKKVAEELVADFGVDYYDEIPVRIGCRRYYQLPYDDIDTVCWDDAVREDGIIEGVIIHAVYLESFDGKLPHIASKHDFRYGRGLPCLVVADDDRETISFIPAVEITSFAGSNDIHD